MSRQTGRLKIHKFQVFSRGNYDDQFDFRLVLQRKFSGKKTWNVGKMRSESFSDFGWSWFNSVPQRRPISSSFHFQRVFIRSQMKNQIASRISGDRKLRKWAVETDCSFSDIGRSQNENQHFKKLTIKHAKLCWTVSQQRDHEELSQTILFQKQHNQRCNASIAMS